MVVNVWKYIPGLANQCQGGHSFLASPWTSKSRFFSFTNEMISSRVRRLYLGPIMTQSFQPKYYPSLFNPLLLSLSKFSLLHALLLYRRAPQIQKPHQSLLRRYLAMSIQVFWQGASSWYVFCTDKSAPLYSKTVVLSTLSSFSLLKLKAFFTW